MSETFCCMICRLLQDQAGGATTMISLVTSPSVESRRSRFHRDGGAPNGDVAISS